MPRKIFGKSGIGFSVTGLCLLLYFSMCSRVVESKLVKQNNANFTRALYKIISEEGDAKTNLLFSPLALEIVLAVAGLGAEGKTRAQISDGLGLQLNVPTLQSRFDGDLSEVEEGKGRLLRIATQIFVDLRFPIAEDFVRTSADGFRSGTQSLDFHKQLGTARKKVDRWAENATGGFIPNILPPDDISDTSEIKSVLVSAVYFKWRWHIPFDPLDTAKKTFHMDGDLEANVKMMHVRGRFLIGESELLNAKMIELPFEGQLLSMMILLPERDSSVARLEALASNSAVDLDEFLSVHMSYATVDVYLPKFTMEISKNLRRALEKLGMRAMFTDQADFSGVTKSPADFRVSDVMQKAVIKVTEGDGNEAEKTKDLAEDVQEFQANRPFVFSVYNKATKTRILVGRLADPRDLS